MNEPHPAPAARVSASADAHARHFEAHRRHLLGLAYRILGSRADAEDAVQDTYLKWRGAEGQAIDSPRAWLTAVCTRRAIDLLRAAHRSRVEYVGAWLPEPLHTEAAGGSPEDTLALASSLSTAFLLLLERLSPRERAAYLLHEVFDTPYPEVAATLGVQEAACRKLVSRARSALGEQRARHAVPRQRQEQLLAAFHEAIAGGATAALAGLLSQDIELSADGGGKVPTVMHTLRGPGEVLGFLAGALRSFWEGYAWEAARINGGIGLILRDAGAPAAAVTFGYDAAGRANRIYVVRNPEKLARLDVPAVPR